MAPNEASVKLQTELLIFYLLADEDELQSRNFPDSELEHDGPEDSFDPVLVADKLKTIAAALNKEAKCEDAFKKLVKVAADEAIEKVFSEVVETLCNSYTMKGADVVPEVQLIRASVALGLYMKKNAPDLKEQVPRIMISFLNNRVGSWVAKQGGWDKVSVDK